MLVATVVRFKCNYFSLKEIYIQSSSFIHLMAISVPNNSPQTAERNPISLWEISELSEGLMFLHKQAQRLGQV